MNYATDKAAVTYDPDAVTPAELCDAVASLGYEAHLPAAEPDAHARRAPRHGRRRTTTPSRSSRRGSGC